MPKSSSQTDDNKVQQDNPPVVPMSEDTLPPIVSTDVVNNQPSEPTTGSSAPTDDVVSTPITTTPTLPKKKFAGGKIIATVLGLFLLVGGIGAGLVLVQQDQNIQEKAARAGTCSCKNENGVNAGYGTCLPDGSCDCSPNEVKNNACVRDGGGEPPDRTPAEWKERCQELWRLYPNCNTSTWANCHAEMQSDCQGYGTEPPPPPAPTPAPTPNVNAACQSIKAYDTSWAALTNAQLAQLKVGDTVNFCASGMATSGVFTKARFTINSALQPDVANQRPSSNDYCQGYTIPAGVTSFNVRAELYHSTLGWR